MPIITAIKPQKDKGRVSIYLDKKFGFGIDLENFVKLKLKVEQELSEEEIEGIKNTAEYQKLANKIINYAFLRPRSVFEIETWMKKRKLDPSTSKKLIKKLKKINLYDDEAFAKWWVAQRLEFKNKSKRELQFELRKKRVDTKIIDKILGEAEIDDKSAAKKLLEKNKWKWKKHDDKIARQKKSEYLGRKGFSWDTIKEVVD